MKVWYEVEEKRDISWLQYDGEQHSTKQCAEEDIRDFIREPETRIVKVTETREVVE